MEIMINSISGNRILPKLLRKVRAEVRPLIDALCATKLMHPLDGRIAVVLLDEDESFVSQTRDEDGIFTVSSGYDKSLRNDTDGASRLTKLVIARIEHAIRNYGFTPNDQAKYFSLINKFPEQPNR